MKSCPADPPTSDCGFRLAFFITCRCSAAVRVLAVITEPQQVLKILRHFVKIGTTPPGGALLPLTDPRATALARQGRLLAVIADLVTCSRRRCPLWAAFITRSCIPEDHCEEPVPQPIALCSGSLAENGTAARSVPWASAPSNLSAR